MFTRYLARRQNFKRLLAATEQVADELAGRGASYFASLATPELHFSRAVDGLEMDFDVDWHMRKDGRLAVDVVGSGPLPTNGGVRPRKFFLLANENDES